MRGHWQIIAAGLMMAVVACREDAPVQDRPLSEAERGQFNNPLQLACWQGPGSWPQFAHDPLHTGRAEVDLGSSELQLAWQFRPPGPVRSHRPGFSVWSSPVVGTVDGRALVIAGYCDRVVYAVDGKTGEKVWEFRSGACVFASPALGLINGRPMVFLAARNRWIYGLDAATGEQVWPKPFETAPWSFTMNRSVMSSPTVVQDGRTPVVVIGVHNSDRSATRNLQQGEVIVLNAADGTLRWRKRVSSVPVSSPAVAWLDGALTVFVASRHGMVHALALSDGSIRWESVLNEETWSSPSLGLEDSMARLFVGTRFNALFALDLRTGSRRWRRDAGYWIDATPAWFVTPGRTGHRTTVVAGSYDRSIYAWSVGEDGPLWKATTGNHAYSSAAVATLGGAPVVLAMSWDQHMYLLEGKTGETLWKVKCGPLLWSHAFMGDSLWASPVVADIASRPTVLFPACDGVLYAYRPREPAAAVPASGPG